MVDKDREQIWLMGIVLDHMDDFDVDKEVSIKEARSLIGKPPLVVSLLISNPFSHRNDKYGSIYQAMSQPNCLELDNVNWTTTHDDTTLNNPNVAISIPTNSLLLR